MRDNDFYSIDGVLEIPSDVEFEEFHDKFMSFLESNKYLFSGTLGKWMGEPPKHFTEEEFEEEFGCDND